MKKIKQIEKNEKYFKTLEKHPEAGYKVETEKLKILIAKKVELNKVITKLNSGAYKRYIKNLWETFYRYLMLAEAEHYHKRKKNAEDYISTARIFNKENKSDYLKMGKYLELKKLIEDE